MKIGIAGLWHLGSVTAACMASVGHTIIAYDDSEGIINQLKLGIPPIFEPGLEKLITNGIKNNNLIFSNKLSDLKDTELLWITYDTPVDDDDHANIEFVYQQTQTLMGALQKNCIILISSQLPIGSTKKLQNHAQYHFPEKCFRFAYSPENLRLGKALDVFLHPDRVIVGFDKSSTKEFISSMFKPITNNIIWMTIPSAEMTKHAINAFLANSVTFINELSVICEKMGADAGEVEKGLKSEARIGPKAYLHPGSAFAGGTLARDIQYLINAAQENNLDGILFSSILDSNNSHKQWVCRTIQTNLNNLSNKRIAFIGLTYKEGTNTLRRSLALENALWLANKDATITAYDPLIKEIPNEFSTIIKLKNSILEAIEDKDAIIIENLYPEILNIPLEIYKNKVIIDGNGLLEQHLLGSHCKYYKVGKSYATTE